MKLTEDIVQSFKPYKTFQNCNDRPNSIDFGFGGKTLITSSDEEKIDLYNCQYGDKVCTLFSKKYGISLIRFTHARHTVIHSSTKVDDSLRYLSLYDNKYIRFYTGHTARVTSLCVSPLNDTFMSSSLDKSVRLWDLRSPNCEAVLHVPDSRSIINFDPEGLIFAVGYNSEILKLYDLTYFESGPFSTIKLPKIRDYDWTGLKFSPDGNTILISTNRNIIYLIDAFSGRPLQVLTGFKNHGRIPFEASFSSDSQYVFSGSEDENLYVWKVSNGEKLAEIWCNHIGPIHHVQFNPRYAMLATACTKMTLWLPDHYAAF